MARPRELILRAPNHLGDLVMALPALEVAGAAADTLVLETLAPLLELSGFRGRVLPLERGAAGFWSGVRRLRRGRYRRGVLLPPSFSSALLFRLGGVRERRGMQTDGRSMLLTEPVPLHRLAGLHRSAVYFALVTGSPPAAPLVPRVRVAAGAREAWARLVGGGGRPVVGLFPGGHAPSRRWDGGRFAALARALAARGARVIVFGGPAERELTARVAGQVAVDAGGRTDLPLLAAGLADCHLLVSNDSGPLHLAAAVGTPTVSLWGAGNPAVTGPAGAAHRLLRRPELPCVPCVKNRCPRSGRGYVLERAEVECLKLIEVGDVLAAVEAALAARGTET
ncbi:MAG: glycosyltransferase family 9 protein [Gemmatimonadetes bacterium]|nr:glycosyltransferase family 9 protein [Gemmatimonadota bacterium]